MRLKDLASQLGLSQTTVSRALNGYPEVNEATRQRVAEAAAKLGYRPNASALRLATGQARAIGLVLRSSTDFGPHMTEFLAGLGSGLAHREVDILVSSVDSDAEEMATYRRMAASQSVNAVLLHSPTLQDSRAKLLAQLGIPFLLHGRTEIDTPHAWLDIDNTRAIAHATAHLLDLGHRRIALLNGLGDRTFALHREQGYRQALATRAIPLDPGLVANLRFTDEAAFKATQNLLDLPNPPTAFLAGSMMTALGIFRAARLAGLTLGEHISIIAHDDVFPYLNADNMVPSMSTTRSSMRAAGVRIAELLLQMQDGKPAATIHELWPVDLVLRQSTGPAPSR